MPDPAPGNAGMQPLPRVCRSCQLLPFCWDSSDAATEAVTAHGTLRSSSQRIWEAKSVCHMSASPPASPRASQEQHAAVLQVEQGLRHTLLPTEWNCPAMFLSLRDWHLQTCLLFSIKISLVGFRSPSFLGTAGPPSNRHPLGPY